VKRTRETLRLKELLRESTSKPIQGVLSSIASAGLKVWENIPLRAGLLDQVNPSGERQAALDVFANDVFAGELLETGHVSEVASEEMNIPRMGMGTLHVAMDPLDGSSNIETNNPLGSIFGVYDTALPCSGEHLQAAAYITYGPTLTLTFGLDGKVHRFVASRRGSGFDFVLQTSKLRIPRTAQIYGFGGVRKDWISPVQTFVLDLERRGMRVRYCGTFVGDFNQILKYGGIFAYPASKTKPKGKLRLLYEIAPMAFIANAAGGYATNGLQDILRMAPKELSETSPAYLGSKPLVKELERALSSA
jgi:fructose-1,6-bisphosphatase I